MTSAHSNILAGTALAMLAALSWALNFIAPYITGAYSIHDFMLIRFLVAGTLGIGIMLLYRAQLGRLSRGQQILAAGLGVIGYFGYSNCIAAGVMAGGPVLTPAFIGLVPVLLALMGNSTHKTLAWSRLLLPLILLTSGLLLSSLGGPAQPGQGPASWSAGLFFSISAVTLWLVFSFLNQRALKSLPDQATAVWTGLMMAGAGLATLCALPVVQAMELLRLPSVGASLSAAGHLYLWGLVIALSSSLLGAWAWNAASRRLPMVLSGQLIALESLFATLLGLLFHGRLPTVPEAAGLIALLTGVVMAVRIILDRSARPDQPDGPPLGRRRDNSPMVCKVARARKS